MSKLVLSAGKHDEYGDSAKLNRLFSGHVIEGLGLTPSTGMTLKLLPGTGRVPTGSGLGSFFWPFLIDTSGGETVTAGTADGTNPRMDSVVAYIIPANNGLVLTNNPTSLALLVVPGVPASSPSAPDDSAISAAVAGGKPWIRLWDVRVPAGVSTSASFVLTDRRNFLKPTFGAPYVDANGWTVIDHGTRKEYHREFTSTFGSVAINPLFSYVAVSQASLPVGAASLNDFYWQASGRTSNVNVESFALHLGAGADKFDIRGHNLSNAQQSITSHRVEVMLLSKPA